MRSNYMVEFQTNYEQNAYRKEDLMTQVSNEITSQNAALTGMKAEMVLQKQHMQKFLKMR